MIALILAASLILATAGVAIAGPYKGINLGWFDCPNQGAYQFTRQFACDSNEGSQTLVGSFVAPAGMEAVTGFAAVIDVRTLGGVAGGWWDLRAALPAGCRPTSMTSSFDFTGGPFGCHDYWQAGAMGGSSAQVPSGNNVRLMTTAALPLGDSRIGPITAGTEVYVFKLTINNARTVGPGSCAGCSGEACILLNSILVTQTSGHPNITISNPAASMYVLWQGWSTTDPSQACPFFSPTKNRTWGAIKAVYR